MKKLVAGLFSFILLALCSCISENSSETPEVVKNEFSKMFPDATDIRWEKENEDEWEAEFKQDDQEVSSKYSIDGKWLETEKQISINALPELILSTLDKEFNGYKIEKAEI